MIKKLSKKANPVHKIKFALAECSFACWLAVALALVGLFMGCTKKSPDSFIEMPARFVENRIFVDVAVTPNDTLTFYTDTGGGLFLYGPSVDRLGWQDSSGIMLSDVTLDKNFPDALGSTAHRISVFRPEQKIEADFDGMLGQAWFADRIWRFDYRLQKLQLYHSPPQMGPEFRESSLGFLTDSLGNRRLSFPRITITVDGENLDLLFDTGAMVHLTSTAKQRFAPLRSSVIATSFITADIFDQWKTGNPDWPVIENADTRIEGMRMIRVSEIEVAGFKAGPVWFLERPTANFRNYMSKWMDRPIDGAIGGNILKHFDVILDYPKAKVYLQHSPPF